LEARQAFDKRLTGVAKIFLEETWNASQIYDQFLDEDYLTEPHSGLYLQVIIGASYQNEVLLVGPCLCLSEQDKLLSMKSLDCNLSKCAFETSVLILLNLNCSINYSSL
jgi:hypothetical protein